MIKKVKKISYLSAIIIVISSTIGAGIFIKNKELFKQAQGSLSMVIAAWSVAGIGMLALVLAIVEMISVSKTNKGVLEWFKNFMPSWAEKSAKSYFHMFFIPITLFTLPLYAVQSMQDAGLNISKWGSLLIGISIFSWCLTINWVSIKLSEKFQWITTIAKLIPIVVIPIYSFLNSTTYENFASKSIGAGEGLLGISPWMVIIGGIPVIAFAFDGFYEASSLQNEIKEPKKIGSILFFGVVIIIIIYIFITISFSVGSSTGSYSNISNISPKVMKMFNILLSIGIMGIVNGYAMATIQQNKNLYEEGESPIISSFNSLLLKFKIKIKSSSNISALFTFVQVLFFFLLFGIVGMYGWKEDPSYGYGESSNMYGFTDILVNYTTSLTFVLIIFSLFGVLKNRKTNVHKVKKKKYFIPATIISSIIILSGCLMQVVVAIFDISGFNDANRGNAVISLIVFAGLVSLSLIAGLIENKYKSTQ